METPTIGDELVDRMAVGEFEHWYRTERRRVYASVLVLCGDAETAREATDEAFARALERWKRVSTMESPGAWVQTVAINQMRTIARRRKMELTRLRRKGVVREPSPTAPDSGWVWDAVRRLPPRQRLAIVLRYIADRSDAEIAQTMGVSRGTVASTLSAARASLAVALGPEPITTTEVRDG